MVTSALILRSICIFIANCSPTCKSCICNWNAAYLSRRRTIAQGGDAGLQVTGTNTAQRLLLWDLHLVVHCRVDASLDLRRDLVHVA
ncbi:hypothetical protein PR002_g18816, partial [Phytophthora rubi]